MSGVEANPQSELTVDIATQTVRVGSDTYSALIPAGAREALTSGTWDATGLLLDDFGQVQKVAQSLPYVSGFKT